MSSSLFSNSRTFTILSGAALSDAHVTEQATPLGLYMPAAWTAANLTLQFSLDGVTWFDVDDPAGAEVSWVVMAGTYLAIKPSALVALGNYTRLRSGTGAAPVNQAANAAIILCYRRFT